MQWVEDWSQERIDASWAYDHRSKEIYFGVDEPAPPSTAAPKQDVAEKKSAWNRLKSWWN